MTQLRPKKWAFELNNLRARPEGKKGVYVAHYRVNGQHAMRSLGTKRLERARMVAIELDRSLEAGEYSPRPANHELGEAITMFLAAKEIDGLAPKSSRKYTTELRNLESFALENSVRTVRQVDESFLAKYRHHRAKNNLLQQHRALHPKTAYTATMIVVSFLRWTVRRKMIPANPLQDVKISKPPFQRKYAPSLAVINTILEKASEPTKTILSVLAFTGMRSGELQALTIGDVDLSAGWLRVQTFKTKLTRIRPIRKVPIHPRLKPILLSHLKVRKGHPSEPLFVAKPSKKYPEGQHVINTKKLNDHLKRVARSVSVLVGRMDDGIVIHSFRHGFETIAVNSNIPQRVIDTWLGHTGDRSMGSVYYRLDETDSLTFMAKVGF
jgi:integrase